MMGLPNIYETDTRSPACMPDALHHCRIPGRQSMDERCDASKSSSKHRTSVKIESTTRHDPWIIDSHFGDLTNFSL